MWQALNFRSAVVSCLLDRLLRRPFIAMVELPQFQSALAETDEDVEAIVEEEADNAPQKSAGGSEGHEFAEE